MYLALAILKNDRVDDRLCEQVSNDVLALDWGEIDDVNLKARLGNAILFNFEEEGFCEKAAKKVMELDWRDIEDHTLKATLASTMILRTPSYASWAVDRALELKWNKVEGSTLKARLAGYLLVLKWDIFDERKKNDFALHMLQHTKDGVLGIIAQSLKELSIPPDHFKDMLWFLTKKVVPLIQCHDSRFVYDIIIGLRPFMDAGGVIAPDDLWDIAYLAFRHKDLQEDQGYQNWAAEVSLRIFDDLSNDVSKAFINIVRNEYVDLKYKVEFIRKLCVREFWKDDVLKILTPSLLWRRWFECPETQKIFIDYYNGTKDIHGKRHVLNGILRDEEGDLFDLDSLLDTIDIDEDTHSQKEKLQRKLALDHKCTRIFNQLRELQKEGKETTEDGDLALTGDDINSFFEDVDKAFPAAAALGEGESEEATPRTVEYEAPED